MIKGINSNELRKVALEINSLSKEIKDILSSINTMTYSIRDDVYGDFVYEMNKKYDVIAKNFKIVYKNTVFVEEYLKNVIANYDRKQHEISENLQ